MHYRILPIASLLLAVLAAGCLEAPLDEARPGDRVTVELEAVHVDSGMVLLEERRTFILGEEDPEWPEAAAGLVAGARVQEARSVQVPADASVSFAERIETEPARSEMPREQVHPLARLQDEWGILLPEPGATYEVNVWTVRVLEVADGTVRLEVVLEDGDSQRIPLPGLGGFLVSRLEGDIVVSEVEPVVGLVFTQQFSDGHLARGAYKVMEHDGSGLVLGRNPDPDVFLSGMDVVYRVTVLDVERSTSNPAVRDPGGLSRGGGGSAEPDAPAHHAH